MVYKGRGLDPQKNELRGKSGIYEIALQLPNGHEIGRTNKVVISAGNAELSGGGLRKRILSYCSSSGGGGPFANKIRPYIVGMHGLEIGGFHVYWRWMEIKEEEDAKPLRTRAAELRLLNTYDYDFAKQHNGDPRESLWSKVAGGEANYVAIFAHLKVQSTDKAAAAVAAAIAAGHIAAVD